MPLHLGASLAFHTCCLSCQTVLGIILGGGAGTRLYPLTKKRAKPAVPLGANYRLIDIPVSNCVNSNVTKIYCLTQFNSASLNRHLSQAYVSAGAGSVQQHNQHRMMADTHAHNATPSSAAWPLHMLHPLGCAPWRQLG